MLIATIPYPICEVQTTTSQCCDYLSNLIDRHNELSFTFQTIESRFNSLMETWKQDVQYSSSISEIATNKAYLQIIAMGEKVLPLIFNAMANEPHHWFVALTSITGVNPIKTEHKGNLKEMTNDWLTWAKMNKYYVA